MKEFQNLIRINNLKHNRTPMNIKEYVNDKKSILLLDNPKKVTFKNQSKLKNYFASDMNIIFLIVFYIIRI